MASLSGDNMHRYDFKIKERYDDVYKQHMLIRSFFTNSEKVLFRIDNCNVVAYSDKEPVNISYSKKEIKIDNAFNFRLRANVFKTKGKPIPIIEPELIKEWIIKKSLKNGFKLLNVFQTSPYCIKGFKEKTNNRITLNVVDFFGSFEVEDNEKFENVLYNGFGHGKPFGLGLIEIFAH